MTPLDQVARHYNRLAQTYDRRWATYTQHTLNRILEAIPLVGTERVLDVACGTGELERLLRIQYPALTLVGIDVAPAMLAVARHKLAGDPRVGLCLAPGEALPFAGSRFDIVVWANALHHVREPRQVLRECARVLRSEGRLLLLDWCLDFWHCRLLHAWLRLTDPTYVSMYRLTEVQAMLEPLGFTTVQASRFLAPPAYGLFHLTARRQSGGAMSLSDPLQDGGRPSPQ